MSRHRSGLSTGPNGRRPCGPGCVGPLANLAVQAGLAADLTEDDLFSLLFSSDLQFGFTTRALLGTAAVPDAAVLVGPALADRPGDPDFAWDRLDPRRSRVLVTVGTLHADAATDFFRRTVAALEPLADRLQAIVVAPAEAVPDPPDHVVVAPRVPVLALMPHLDLVVCHGGMGTVAEALAHGVPLVVAPITLDQPTTAAQVDRAGAGVRVDFARVSAERLRDRITAVLGDPAYRRAAQRVRESFVAAGGAEAAADHLVRLACGPA